MESGGLPNDPLFAISVPSVTHECIRSENDVFIAEVFITLANNVKEWAHRYSIHPPVRSY